MITTSSKPSSRWALLLLLTACAPTGSTGSTDTNHEIHEERVKPEPSASPEPSAQPEPSAPPDAPQGKVSCTLPEIPDADTLELWLEAKHGSRFKAMARSAGSESPVPGETTRLDGFEAAPAGDWPLGVYTSGTTVIHIEARASARSEHDRWSGFVVDGDSKHTITCAYFPGPAPCDFEADPHKRYVGRSPDQCAVMKFGCEGAEEFFADHCGCGCLSP